MENLMAPLRCTTRNGQLEEVGTYKDGEFDGPIERYNENGQLEQKGTHKDGGKQGPFEM